MTIGTALTDNPRALLALRVAGVAVLLWLSWKIATAGRSGPAKRERPIGFFDAVALSMGQPEGLADLRRRGQLHSGRGPPPMCRRRSSALIEVVVGTPCMLLWLGFGAAMQRLLRTDRALRAFNIAMGVLLAATVPLLF